VGGTFFTRAMRSVPIAGLAVQLSLRGRRLRAARAEDAAYRAAMFSLGERARFTGASERQERGILAGELLGQLVACGVGAVAYSFAGAPLLVFLATWPVAFFADWLGGALALRLFERRQPTVEEIVDDVQRE
jgi:hypothetical protein